MHIISRCFISSPILVEVDYQERYMQPLNEKQESQIPEQLQYVRDKTKEDIQR